MQYSTDCMNAKVSDQYWLRTVKVQMGLPSRILTAPTKGPGLIAGPTEVLVAVSSQKPYQIMLSALFLDHDILGNFDFIQSDSSAGPKMDLHDIPRLFGGLLNHRHGVCASL